MHTKLLYYTIDGYSNLLTVRIVYRIVGRFKKRLFLLTKLTGQLVTLLFERND